MKDIKIERLCRVIEDIQDGALWLDPAVAHVLHQNIPNLADNHNTHQESQPAGKRKRYNAHLTDRETEVLTLIVEGESNKEIATELDVSPHTVKSHVTNIIQKLAVDDRTQAAVKALRNGLIQGSPSSSSVF